MAAQLTVASALDLPALTAAWNLVYTDYVVPLRFSPAQLAQHCALHAIRLERSPLQRAPDGALQGLALLGVRDTRGWVGGFGIAPAARGQGHSHALCAALIRSAADLGLAAIRLEVLTQNSRAYQTYQRAGFGWRRDLRIFTHDAVATNRTAHEEVWEAAPAPLLTLAATRQAQLSWQRQPASLAATPNLAALAIGPQEAPSAFALYRSSDLGIQVVDMSAATVAELAGLTAALHARAPGLPMRLGNEPAESPLCPLLEASGWREIYRQHEMEYSA